MPVVTKAAICIALIALVACVLSRPATLRRLNARMPGEPPESRPWFEYPLYLTTGLLGATLAGTALGSADPLGTVQGVLFGMPFVVISVVSLYGATLQGSKKHFLLRAYDGSVVCRRALAVAVCSWFAFFNSPLIVWLWETL